VTGESGRPGVRQKPVINRSGWAKLVLCERIRRQHETVVRTSPSASAAACRGTRHRPGRRQASGAACERAGGLAISTRLTLPPGGHRRSRRWSSAAQRTALFGKVLGRAAIPGKHCHASRSKVAPTSPGLKIHRQCSKHSVKLAAKVAARLAKW